MNILLDSNENPDEPEQLDKSRQPKEKQRKKSNFEKGIENIFFDKFSSSNKSEMEW